MKIRVRTVCKLLGAAVGLLLAAGIAAPYFSAQQYAERLRASLSRALGRQVEFRQPVKFNLFQGPGFSVDDVVIHEDPSIGTEPIAYMATMDVRPSIWSLLGGRFVISSIRLENADINLTKAGSPDGTGRWNFLSFISRSVMSAAPAIQVRNGRINFKFGDTKSVFYLTEADLDISPEGSHSWRISCSAKAARTDRPAQGLGTFSIKGRWFVEPERVDLDVELDRSGLGEITALLHGQEGTVHGTISSRLHLGGPIDDIGIQGRMQVEDVHRWDLLPTSGRGWPFDIRGRLNLVSQQIELQSNSPGNAPLPLWIRFRAADYLSQPRWAMTVNWNRFPVAPILELARHMGAQLPPGLQMAGVMDGAVGYTWDGDFQGQVAFYEASVTIPDSPTVRFEQGGILFGGGHIRLSPTLVRASGDDQEEAQIEADYDLTARTLDLAISTGGMQVKALRAQVALAAVPWLDQVRSGQWSGQLHYHQGASQAGWTGRLQLSDAEIPVPGLADPVQLAAARAQIDGARVVLDRIDAQAGDVEFTGGYSYDPAAPRPHHLRLHMTSLDASDLEAELMPTLRRSTGLLARAFGRTSVPPWLRQRAVDGYVKVDDLLLAGAHLQNVQGHLLWDVTRIEMDSLQAKLEHAVLTGKLTVNLRGALPAYRLAAQVKGLNWNAGTLDGEGNLQTSGTGAQLWANLTSDGTFTGAALDFGGFAARSVTGNFSLAPSAPRFRLSGLTLQAADDTYTGRGSLQDDGRLLIVLSNGVRQVRVSGPPANLKVEEPHRP